MRGRERRGGVVGRGRVPAVAKVAVAVVVVVIAVVAVVVAPVASNGG